MNNDINQLEALASEYSRRGLNLTDDYRTWLLFAFGCASFGEAGRSAFHTFSSSSPKYNHTTAEKQFTATLRTYDGPPSNLGYLLNLIPRHLLDFSQVYRGAHLPRATPRCEAPPVDILSLIGY